MGLTREDLKKWPEAMRKAAADQMRAQGSDYLDKDEAKPGALRRVLGYILHADPDRQFRLDTARKELTAIRERLARDNVKTVTKMIEAAETALIDELQRR